MQTEQQKINITYNRDGLTEQELIYLYKSILLPRLIEDKMLVLLRQGKISKWFSGYGQEAISVGAAAAMLPEEFILPMHRNLGMFTTRGIELKRLFAQFQGKESGFTKGRDRSFHFGSIPHKLVGMISHLGPQLGIADGIALATKLAKENLATLVVSGDGGASEGDFHEALNVAAVWDLPVIFLVENNQWGLSTPSNEQFKCKQFIDKGIGYGMQTAQVDGNNILEVFKTVKRIAKEIRENPKPYLLECLTFRIRGHEEASGTKYYPEGIIEQWQQKDPVLNYELFLLQENILTPAEAESIRADIRERINVAFKEANEEPVISSTALKELADVYAPSVQPLIKPSETKHEMRFIDAISAGLDTAMEKHEKLVLMGQDIADYGGVFKITEGFVAKYGKDRVRNTPLCESAIVGAALGLSIKGYKAMMEMQFADFVSVGFNQIVNNLAKIHYRWGQNADVVVRMPTGAGTGAGPFHSQSNEAWFTHTPGLKVVYPSTPEDAKGLLLAAFEDPNPVLYFEHKALYRSLKGLVPEGYYTTPIGKARTAKAGNTLSILTYGMGVHWALDLAEKQQLDIEIIDLRTLLPLDYEAINETIKKTGRVVILHEDTLFGGIGGEIAAYIAEHLFTYLDAPIGRVGSLDTPVPFAIPLENEFLASKRLEECVLKVLNF
ncbi:MAG: alpha-ketoacid dehydrogenase subunit alpha/beta [Luteibaculaceae bacterium]